MSEIKSTMELVLERAARLGRATDEEMHVDALLHRGRQLGAEFLDHAEEKPESLAGHLTKAPEAERGTLRRGMLATMLHNLFLPRDESGKKRVERALAGLLALHGGARQTAALCAQLAQLAGRYEEHRKQIQEQLKEQLRMQLQQSLAQERGIKVDASKIDPALDPRFAQEWGRIEAELNSQYGQALEQCRSQLFALSGV